MHLISGMEIINIADNIMAVSTGDAASVYKGIINMNKTAYKIWQHIEAGLSLEAIAERFSHEYQGLTYDDAYSYVREFTDQLIAKGILLED